MHGDRVVARITRDERFRRAKSARDRRGRTRHPHSRTRTRYDRRHASAIEEFLLRGAGRSAHRAQRLRPGRRNAGRVPHRATRSSSAWRRGNRATSIRKGEIIEVLGPEHRARRRHAFDHSEVSSSDGISGAMSSRKRSRFRRRSTHEMFEGREDLREQFIVTIDPDDARDFDDAINVERLPEAAGDSACTSRTWRPT